MASYCSPHAVGILGVALPFLAEQLPTSLLRLTDSVEHFPPLPHHIPLRSLPLDAVAFIVYSFPSVQLQYGELEIGNSLGTVAAVHSNNLPTV